jgi:hypothetical protein
MQKKALAMRIGPQEAAKLEELEKSLHRREVRNAAQIVDQLLADDFVEIGRSGRVYDKTQILSALAAESGVVAVETDNFQFRTIADGVVLLTYVTRTTDGAGSRAALRSSIWKQIDGRWQMLFHQGTPTDVPWIETA